MSDHRAKHCGLPFALPEDRIARTSLVIFRRMAIHGLRDSRAVMLALDTFGPRFAKLLELHRCFLHEVALASSRNISVAPCCAPRMTRDEALMCEAISNPDLDTLGTLTQSPRPGRALSAAIALGWELDQIAR